MTLEITTATTEDIRTSGSEIAVLPIGAFEQHGPCLPLTTDTLIANAIASEIAAAHAVTLLPPITFSCSHEHSDWAGTVSISHRTLSLMIEDIATSLCRSGVKQLVLINAHGGNYVLGNIVQQANAETLTTMALFPRSADWQRARVSADLVSSMHDDMHAGEIETSILLFKYPDAVRDGWRNMDCQSDRPYLHVHGMRPYTPTGVIGYPSKATPQKGEAVLLSLQASFGALLSEISKSD